MESSRILGAESVTIIGAKRHACRILVGKLERKKERKKEIIWKT